jgi:hypothetical protein
LLVAGWTTIASITQAPNMLHGIPGGGVGTRGFRGQVLLWPASSTVVTVVGTDCALTSNTFVSSEALALSSSTITNSFVRALNPGMEIIGVHNTTNPSEVFWASAKRAIRTSPFRFAVDTSVASTVVIELTSSMTRALVLTHTGLAVAFLVPGHLAPAFFNIGRSRCGCPSWLTSGRGWD